MNTLILTTIILLMIIIFILSSIIIKLKNKDITPNIMIGFTLSTLVGGFIGSALSENSTDLIVISLLLILVLWQLTRVIYYLVKKEKENSITAGLFGDLTWFTQIKESSNG